VGHRELGQLCFEIIDNALATHRIKLSEAQIRRFVSGFNEGLLPSIRTPRMAKRYGNALKFALPVLRDEVNPVDLMLIEGLRLLYPKVYDEVKTRKSVFTAGAPLRFLGAAEKKQLIRTSLETCTEFLSPVEREGANALLVELFPSAQAILSGLNYGDQDTWAAEQRICSDEYFDRYFSYSVPEHDLADREIHEFLQSVQALAADELLLKVGSMLANGRAGTLVAKLSRLRSSIPEEASSRLAIALALGGASLPSYRGTVSRSPMDQVAELVANLLRNLRSTDEQLKAAELILRATPSFQMSVAVFQQFTGFMPDVPEADADSSALLGAALAVRARTSLVEEPSLLIDPSVAGFLYAWSKWGNRSELEHWLEVQLGTDPNQAVPLVQTYAQRWTNVATGSATLAFDGMAYRALREVFDPGILWRALITLPENGKALSPLGEDGEATLVEEFVRIHESVMRQMD
jgi:hypothetical protein